MLILAFTATIAAFIVGQIVTSRLVNSGGWWSEPIGRIGFVRANFPVGGMLAFAAAVAVGPPVDVLLFCVAIGFAVSAIFYRA